MPRLANPGAESRPTAPAEPLAPPSGADLMTAFDLPADAPIEAVLDRLLGHFHLAHEAETEVEELSRLHYLLAAATALVALEFARRRAARRHDDGTPAVRPDRRSALRGLA